MTPTQRANPNKEPIMIAVKILLSTTRLLSSLRIGVNASGCVWPISSAAVIVFKVFCCSFLKWQAFAGMIVTSNKPEGQSSTGFARGYLQEIIEDQDNPDPQKRAI